MHPTRRLFRLSCNDILTRSPARSEYRYKYIMYSYYGGALAEMPAARG